MLARGRTPTFFVVLAGLLGCGHSDQEMAEKQHVIDVLSADLKAAQARDADDLAKFKEAQDQINRTNQQVADFSQQVQRLQQQGQQCRTEVEQQHLLHLQCFQQGTHNEAQLQELREKIVADTSMREQAERDKAAAAARAKARAGAAAPSGAGCRRQCGPNEALNAMGCCERQ
jgi:chromosome segregation ATPase